MDLFDCKNKMPQNLLSHDGIALYYGPIIPHDNANNYFDALMCEIAWEHDRAIIFGKTIITKRKVAWYADNSFSYTYSKTTKKALPWTRTLLKLKSITEHESGETYNSCLLNLYHDGSQGMAWHSDGERDLKQNGAIGSISLGAERKFALKNKKTKEVVTKVLEHGSLLVMKGTTQTHWVHRLPPTKIVHTPRINLTFRNIATG